jgi:hypothetical protein
MGIDLDVFEKLGKKVVEPFEDFIDKQFNLRLAPDIPTFGRGKKGAKKTKDYSNIIAALQRRMLESVQTPGRQATIATTPRGIQ